MAEVNLKEILADMIYDQPREKVVEALNIVHSTLDKCKNLAHIHTWGVDYKKVEKFKSLYGTLWPSELMKSFGFEEENWNEIEIQNILRYLKDQQKFLSRKLAWIDKGMQEI